MKTLTLKLASWASIVEPDAMAQAQRISEMPFIYPHVGVMPDVHLGKGAAIGLVIPTLNAILPAAVGVDIGCGMMAEKTQWVAGDLAGKDLSTLRKAIEHEIPLSAGGRNGHVRDYTKGRVDRLTCQPGVDDAYRESPDWPLQLGTLGSGNHFIELVLDETDAVWMFLHSGSRGVGNRLAMRHIKKAQEMCRQYGVELADPDLAYLASDTSEFWEYYTDLVWAQKFALLNREEMMFRATYCLSEWMGSLAVCVESVQCHHNYTEEMPEALRGQFPPVEGTIFLSRKGAIDASEGRPGLIPGSMGDASYVVEGLGSKMSLWTSPHGAGRRRSRGAAKREFTFDDLETRMEGIEWRHTDAFLDEHPLAYKPIDQVMKDSEELVTISHKFRQVLNVKGD
jgi:tRNA-splicing ligase RtcB